MSALNSAVGSYSTLSLNISGAFSFLALHANPLRFAHRVLGANLLSRADFSRYANRPSAVFSQAIVIPIIFTSTAMMGIVIASGGYKVCRKFRRRLSKALRERCWILADSPSRPLQIHNLAAIQFDPMRLMK
jgi:fructose-bisphosphate aldolase class 1